MSKVDVRLGERWDDCPLWWKGFVRHLEDLDMFADNKERTHTMLRELPKHGVSTEKYVFDSTLTFESEEAFLVFKLKFA